MTDLLELEAITTVENPDAELQYGRHSLYLTHENTVDVRDILDREYPGRHSYEWLYDHRQLPTPAYDFVNLDYEDW